MKQNVKVIYQGKVEYPSLLENGFSEHFENIAKERGGDMNKQNQTRCIDYIICPYCGHKFDGQNAINGDMDCMINPECPKCNKEMEVSISVEYMATAIEY